MRRLTLFCALLLLGCDGLSDIGGGGGVGELGFTRGIAFVQNADIWLADASDFEGQVAQLTSEHGNGQPALSRDGTQVAYVHGDAAGNSGIFSVPSSGGAPRELVPLGPHAFDGLCWSPAGEALYFADQGGIFSIGADGVGQRRVSAGGDSYGSPSVAADGTLYALDANQGAFVRLEGSGSVPSFPAPDAARGAISPDGVRVVYDDDAAGEIFVLDAPNLPPRQLTAIPGSRQRGAAWSTDGTQVFFSSNAGGGENIYVVPASAQGSSGTLVQVGNQPSFGG